jgi:hypothetical protein
MKRITVLSILAFGFSFNSHAQLSINGHFYGEDAFKFSNYNSFGTARTRGMGGSFSALGGDASNIFLNPAGLGFYNKSEFSITPLYNTQNVKSEYIGQNNSLSSSRLNIGQAAVVFSNNGVGTRKKRSAFGLSYNTLANFNNEFVYNGSNNKSSISDYFAEKATSENVSTQVLEDEYDGSTGIAQTPTSMYYQAYLIDHTGNNNYVASELSVPVVQSGKVRESGSLGQFNISYGINFDDKTYLGASVGIQNLNFNQLTDHAESFPKGELFRSFLYGDDLYVNGTGINLTLGGIIKASKVLSIGLNVTTPTAMRIRESIGSEVTIDPLPGTITVDRKTLYTVENDFRYRLTSPLRGNLGAAVFLPSKLGVINVEAEYIGYGQMGIKDSEDARWSSDQKSGIQDTYKDVLNLKAGAEIRVTNIRLRAGVNLLNTPYRNESSANSKSTVQLSLGAGYRAQNFFADLGYSRMTSKSAFTPYTISNPENYASAALSRSQGVVSVTVGTFF